MNARKFTTTFLCIAITIIIGSSAPAGAAIIFAEDFAGTYTFTNDRPVQVRPGDEYWTVDDSRAGSGFVFCGNYADQIEFRTENAGDCRWFFTSQVLVTGDYDIFYYEISIPRHDYGKRNWIGYHIPLSTDGGTVADREDAGLYFEFDFSLSVTNAGIWLADEKLLDIPVTAADRLGLWRIMYTKSTKEVEVFRDGASMGSVIAGDVVEADVFDEVGFGGHYYTNFGRDCRIYYDNFVIKSVPPLEEGDKYWDTSDDTGLQPGAGSWDNSTIMWNESDTGSGSRETWTQGNTAHFSGGGYSEATVNEGIAAHSILVHAGASCYVIAGTNATGTVVGTIDLSAGSSGMETGIFAHGDLVVETAVDKAGPQTWTIANNMIFEITGGISGSGDLVKNGTGILSLNQGWWSAENNFGGKLILNEGHTDIGVGMWSAGSGVGQELVINPGASAIALQPHIGGFSGRPVTIDHGTLTMNLESYLQGITMKSGTIDGNAEIRMLSWVTTLAADDPATISCPLNLFNNAYFEVENGAASPDLEVDLIFGNNNFTKSGPGTMVINNVCSNNGDVTVSRGGLILEDSTNVYAYTGITTVGGAGSASLILNGVHSIPSNFYFVEFDGRLSGEGTIIGTLGGLCTVFGQISPGNSVGTLTTSNDLLMLEESFYRWEVDGDQTDTMVVGGQLAFSNDPPETITIIVAELEGGISEGTNTLFTFGSLELSQTNALKFNDDWQTTAPSLTAPPELVVEDNEIKVVLIPEPAMTVFLAALALLGIKRYSVR
jgi:hypothetical protein